EAVFVKMLADFVFGVDDAGVIVAPVGNIGLMSAERWQVCFGYGSQVEACAFYHRVPSCSVNHRQIVPYIESAYNQETADSQKGYAWTRESKRRWHAIRRSTSRP